MSRFFSIPFQSLWRTATYLQVMVSFMALYLTGELNPAVGAVFVFLWSVGFLMKSPPAWWRPWMGGVVTFTVILGLALAVQQGEFFNSVLYLLFFLTLAKCYSLESARDYVQVQILCFFMVLSTAVITVAFYFAFIFPVYLLLAAVGMMLYGIALEHSRIQPTPQGRKLDGAKTEFGRFGPRFLLGSGANALVIVVLAFVLFFTIPHVSTRKLDSPLSRREPPRERLTGFSEEVTLGSFKRITPDPTVVMRVELKSPPGSVLRRPQALRMRGVALDQYAHNRWRRSDRGREGDTETRYEQQLDLSVPTAPLEALRAEGDELESRILHQQVYQNSDITLRLFAASLPMSISLNKPLRVRFNKNTGNAEVVGFNPRYGGGYGNPISNPFDYSVISHLVDEATPLLLEYLKREKVHRERFVETLRQVNDEDAMQRLVRDYEDRREKDARRGYRGLQKNQKLVPRELLINLQMPEAALMDRIEQLSERMAPGPTDAEIMVQASRFLREQFAYTLEPNMPPGVDPIETFLFSSRRGHCEFYATSLVLMLRARGIPARLVNGFYTTDWNQMAEVFVVKQSDAHTWVEAWHDELGWLTLDPTPPASAGRGAYGEESPALLQNLAEYLRIQWQRFFIDYSRQKQTAIFQEIKERSGVGRFAQALAGLRNRLERRADADEQPAEEGQLAGDARRLAILGAAAAAVLTALAILALWQAVRHYRRRRARRIRSNIDYFNALQRKLERLGWRRPPGMTPGEYVNKLRRQGLAGEGLDWLLELYYRQRFAGVPPEAGERRRAMDVISRLERRGDS